ncbi:MAG TPA: glycosyltransferase family A protein [Chloroflexota bacterium]|nr:glycosyltransferase family A protein [Chloroflexota bacterium]
MNTDSFAALIWPTLVSEVELSRPLPALASSGRYVRALVLVRLHGEPLGQITVALPELGLDPEMLAKQIDASLGSAVQAHLDSDDLRYPVSSDEPACKAGYRQVVSSGPSASIIIATRDRPEVLRRCLDSLLQQEYRNFEIIVVDNSPGTATTQNLLQEVFAGEARVRYVREDKPGLSFSRNRGTAAAHGEILAFTDDDVIADREWLARLVTAFVGDPDVACVTGLVLPLELETAAQVWFEEFGGFGKGFNPRKFDLGANRPPGKLFPYAAGMLGSGNNMAFRAHILRSVGGFDPALGAGALVGGEDLDIFFRLVMAGYTIAYEPAALVHHQHRRDYASLLRQLSDGGVAGYLTKHLLSKPSALPSLAVQVPAGLAYALLPRQGKNAKKSTNYPAELTHAEWRGMATAPWRYVRSRRRARRLATPPAGQTHSNSA